MKVKSGEQNRCARLIPIALAGTVLCVVAQFAVVRPATAQAQGSHPLIARNPQAIGQAAESQLARNKPSASGNRIAALMQERSLPVAFGAIFVAGIALTLTPCVFPMIPIVVGWFLVQGAGRRGKVGTMAGLFVLGLALSYAVLGMSASKAGAMLGSTLQHPAALLFVATILVLLALSMFGLFEIRAPGFIANRSGGREGAIGILLMGALFGVVAAPCVGPFVLALLIYVGQLGKPMLGFWMFFTLALGLGLPFFVLGIFSGALGSLPKAGAWMVTTRKLFGVVLLGAALYFVSPLFVSRGGLKTLEFLPYSTAAIEDAKQAGRPVVLDFSAAWCQPCRKMEKETFVDREVRREGARFVWLRADLTKSGSPEVEAVRIQYEIKGVPTVLLIGSDGQEKDRIVGYTRAAEFVHRMRQVR